MKKYGLAGLCLAVLIGLAGCGSEAAVTEDTLTFEKDNTVSFTIVQDFSADYYDLEELKEMAQEEIDAYDGSGVSITSAEVGADNTLSFVYQFSDLATYADFMGTSCYTAQVSQALKDGYKKDTVLNSVKSGTVTLGDNSVSEYQLMIWNEEISVRSATGILYYSDNLTVTDKKTAKPAEDTSGPYYIIFK